MAVSAAMGHNSGYIDRLLLDKTETHNANSAGKGKCSLTSHLHFFFFPKQQDSVSDALVPKLQFRAKIVYCISGSVGLIGVVKRQRVQRICFARSSSDLISVQPSRLVRGVSYTPFP